jgi:SAM-dependent methyltransferase
VECSACDSIQIMDIPAELERYYPENYRRPVGKPNQVGMLLRKLRGAFVRGARWNIVGGLVLRLTRPGWAEWMTRTHAQADSRILDVGCGEGLLLEALSAAGYRDLTGIDPFVEPIDGPTSTVRIHRRTIDQESGKYDIVMLHHSIEHIPDPAGAMRHVRRLLAPGGWALIRTPVAGSYGWRTYRENWLGLDPPRHLLVPSIEGMQHLAEQAELDIESISFDSTGCCYVVSELWASGKSLPYPRRPWEKRAVEMCGAQRVAQLQQLSRERIRAGDGDHAVYYLRPKSVNPSRAG